MVYPRLWADGNVLTAADLNSNIFKGGMNAQTGSTITITSAEIRMGIVTVTANLVTNGVYIHAIGRGVQFTGPAGMGTNTATIRLRCGTNSNGVSNTAQKTIARYSSGATGTNIEQGLEWDIIYFLTGLTWSSTNYVTITGQMSVATANTLLSCESIEVLYL